MSARTRFMPTAFLAGLLAGSAAMLILGPHADKGDQIWVWEDNTFKYGYWLMSGVSPEHDGRWWSDRDGTFGTFSFKPGRAYLYRHHVGTDGATTGTNFLWKPPPSP